MREPRQLNVQQQNERVLRSLRSEARYWRTHPVPEALQACAHEHGVDLSMAIVLDLEIGFPGMPHLFGELLTPDGRFIRFEIDVDEGRIDVNQWRDVTAEQNLGENNRGTGVGRGALALRLLHELNR